MAVPAKSWFLPFCLLVGMLPAACAPAAAPTGAITAVAATPGGAAVEGWVCQGDGVPPPVVRLSAGGPRSPGEVFAEGVADRPAAAATHCPAGEQARGFAVAVSHRALFRYGGLPVAAAVLPGAIPLGGGGRLLPAYRVTGEAPRSCPIGDMAALQACFARAGAVDRFVFTDDISCASAAECCPDGQATMSLVRQHGKLIEGGGHVLHRSGGQRDCPALRVQIAEDIVLDRLTIDEDGREPPCELVTKPCAPTINVQSARNVRLTGVAVHAGKGNAVRVWDTDGFAMIRSVVADAGIIGVYVGHFRYGPSRNVVVADSVISRARTNGLALQGAVGASPGEPVLIMGNVFSGNHWHGLWRIPNVPGGTTSGGQTLVADGRNIRFTGNIIANGACVECNPPQHVGGIELADLGPPPAGVYGITIDHNTFIGSTGRAAVYQNRGATTVTEAVVADNRMSGYDALDSFAGPIGHARNIVSAEPAALPRPDLAAAPRPGAPADPQVWCAPPATPAQGRLVSAPECHPPDAVIALLGYRRR